MNRSTAEPVLVDILTARMINEAVGGLWVTPINVSELPDEFIDTVAGLSRARGGAGKREAFTQDAFARARAAHPTFGKF